MSAASDNYEVVVGLEVHAQLLTNSKAFNTDSTEYGNLPNTNVSPITLGHPGTLPRFNKAVADYAIKMGLACHCDITRYNVFARKNYFYPDLPKGYQLTQDKTPICTNGHVGIKTKSGNTRSIGLIRIHMEEDAGKNVHLEGETDSLVDFNRTGVPLIEIVSKPEIHSGEEAYHFLTELRKLLRYLDICDGNMEEGSLRCDVNISLRPKGSRVLGSKVEVKNLNSFRNVQRAIDFEAQRQAQMLDKGEDIPSETRNYDATSNTTWSLRTKEELNDYRYFPDPDLQPLVVSEAWIAQIRAEMPSLPSQLLKKFIEEYQLPEYDAQVLTDDKDTALFFDALCQKTHNYKSASNWIMGPVKSYLNDLTLPMKKFPVDVNKMVELIEIVADDKVSYSVASNKIFPLLVNNPEKSPLSIAEDNNLIQESGDDFIKPVIHEVLEANPEKVKAYKGGKKGLLGMFMGEVMKKTEGKADPKKASQMLKEMLD